MIYLTSKISNKQPAISSQQGVTLMLAILVLAVIISIAFSLASVTFIEIRSSGDLVRTEPAYFAADAVAEEALFKVKRNVPNNLFTYSPSLNSVNLASPPPIESSTSTPIVQVVVAKTSTNFASTKSHYPLFDPTCPAPTGTSGTCYTGGSGFGKLKLTYLPTGSTDALKIYLCQFDPTGNTLYNSLVCSDPTDTNYWITPPDPSPSLPTGGVTLQSGNYTEFTYQIDPYMQQELIMYNNGGGNSDIYVQIEAWDDTPSGSGNTYLDVDRKGLPLVGQKAIDISASAAGVLRKIRTTIPVGP